ncbi:nucleoside diphosphate kinase 6-like [Heteronotia binoei]|uniref:nucleoside diphosphate kinase 6-like n=1 Tax=Heteronotia binoei TaxID=13085 RepID=UPI002930BBCC|nr:nucleoside diphosphate kinase 6-like [Heteronotia binoei]
MKAVLCAPQRMLQLTLAIVKPDAMAHPLILQAVHETILSNRFLIVRCRDVVWSRQDSQQFYQEHRGRFFYQRLVEFMASGPMRAYILAHEEAIPFWRSLMGPTKVFRAQHTDPDSIRGTYGLTDTRNSVHGSDSAASARREMAAFFPDFCEEDWYQHEEPRLRSGAVCYDAEAAIHRVPRDGWTERD